MADSPINAGKITVQELKGLNEREQNAQSDLGSFDILKGCVPTNKNTLTRANGCKLLHTFDEGAILQIYQTNDSRDNILVQTRTSLRTMSEAELFNQPNPVTNLTPIASNEEETMSRAVIVHAVTAGSDGGTYTTANTWQQALLNSIIEQVNPDGTAASFLTLASNQITLSAGCYRIRGWTTFQNSSSASIITRLYNITAAAPAWTGLNNEVSQSTILTTNRNTFIEFGGFLNLAGSTILEIQGYMSVAKTTSGFGLHQNGSPFLIAKELYRWIEILKTA